MPTLNWIGKEAVVNHDKEVPFRLLKKVKAHSVGENSQNLIIKGDNLEALKALMPYYIGKVKCIYIDPPYNTGNENWVYNDKVNSPKIKKWLGKVVGGEAQDLCRHDKWLCMMYPRLKLLRDLLSDDGVIFISIDNHEVAQLKILLDEVFGEGNFVEIFSWTKTSTPPALSKKTRKTNEYVLCYEKGKSGEKYFSEELSGGDQPLLNRGNKPRDLKFPKDKIFFKLEDGELKEGKYDRVELKDSITIKGGYSNKDFIINGEFKWTQKKLDEEISNGTTFIIKSKNLSVRFLRENDESYKSPTNYIKEEVSNPVINKKESEVGTNETASSEILELFENKIFDTPKPVSLIKYLVNMVTKFSKEDSIILDSFAGSGTTGHAVLDLNKEDGGNRKFILIEMEDDIAKKITAERIKRAIEKYDYKDGFEYCELDKPLFDENGQIEETCDFNQFATYIYFTETQTNIDKKQIDKNFIGESGETEYYLIYKEKYKNVLNKSFLSKLKKTKNKKVIYADSCMVDNETLEKFNIVFKQIPYEVKVY